LDFAVFVVIDAYASASSSAKDDLLSDGYNIDVEFELFAAFGNIRLTLIRLTSSLERDEYSM
jgi:hypothetical protein